MDLAARHRYAVAASLLASRRVLQLRCGDGEGARLLAAAAASVHAVDPDGPALDAAASALADVENATFEVAELDRIDVGRFDAIVSLEAPADALLPRVRESGAALVVCVAEPSRLGDATVLAQHAAVGSIIAADGAERPDATITLDAPDGYGPPLGYVACVGVDAEVLEGLLRAEAEPVPARRLAELERANESLRRANARLGRERLGRSDAAAAAVAARQKRHEELEAKYAWLAETHAVWVERCLGAEERERELRVRLSDVRLDSMAVLAVTKLMAKLRRGPSA